MTHRNFNCLACCVLLLGILTGVSAAQPQYQWTAIRLHPDGASYSQANGAWGDIQSGTVDPGPFDAGHAALWNGSAGDWTDITPNWAAGAVLNGAHEDWQVGQLLLPRNKFHAGLWNSSADSVVDLQPLERYNASDAKAVWGNMQVGIVNHTQTGQTHAALWAGSAESFIDLNPAGSDQSRALATDGTLQGGWAALPGGGDSEAVLWNGTPESIISLAPQGALESKVSAMAPGLQVGDYRFQGENGRAALWHGTADSLVDMNPSGVSSAVILGTNGQIHTGSANLSGFGFGNAGIWFGEDPDSFVDLSAYLPPEYFGSGAIDVSLVGSTIYVVGTATRGPVEAWLWVGTIPAPGTIPVVLGGLLVLTNGRHRRQTMPT